jgi:TonB family protein
MIARMACLVALMCIATVCLAADHVSRTTIVVPRYPPLALMAGLQGSVTVEVEVDTDGKVISAKANGSDPILQRATEENIRQWSFEPTPGSPRHAVIYNYRIVGERVQSSCPIVIFNLPDRVEISTRPPLVYPNKRRE